MICSESSPAPMHLVAFPGGGKPPSPVSLSLRVTADGVGLCGYTYRYGVTPTSDASDQIAHTQELAH